MNPQWPREAEILNAAIERSDPAERAAYLDQACAGNPALRRKIEALLQVQGQAEEFFAASDLAPALSEVPVTDPTPATIDRYRILERIGEGGFGVVYMAEQSAPVRRRVALKIIKPGMDTRQVVARFEAERQALAMMDHPNIARVFDAGATETGRPYFVMELVRGISVTKYCNQNKLNLTQRLQLFVQICQAIQHAHQKGIIHRDIKPSNIMVTLHDGVPVPKVIDFGIAKAIEMRLTDKTLFTQFEQFMGTPAYMSPEQAEMTGLDIDTRSDIYSLGVLLYELLIGRPPFSTKDLLQRGIDEARRTIREVDPPRPSTRLSTLTNEDLTALARERSAEGPRLLRLVRGDLDWIVMKCLEKDRTRRYETANGLGLDVQRFLHEEPVSARPPTPIYQLQKLVKRHRAAVAAGLVVLAALLVGLALTAWSLLNERAARTKIERARNAESVALDLARQKSVDEAFAHARAEATVTRLEIERAQMLFEAGQASEALSYLARILRREPTNRVVAERTLSALVHRNLSVPLARIPPSANITMIEFSPDGQRLLTTSKDGTVRIRNSRTAEALFPQIAHTNQITAAHFSPDGSRLVTASIDRTVRIWDALTGSPLIPPIEHQSPVLSAEFSPDSQRIATGTLDGNMHQWDVRTGARSGQTSSLAGPIDYLKFSPDGRWLIMGTASNRTVRLVRMADGSTVGTYGTASYQPWRAPSFSSDSTRLLVSPRAQTIEIIPMGSPTNSLVLGTKNFVFDLKCGQFSPDGLQLLTSSLDNAATLWNAETLERMAPRMPHEHAVETADFSPDGQILATGSRDQTVRLWDPRTGKALGDPLRHDAPVTFVQFNADGRRILTRCENGGVWIWALRTDQPLMATLAHELKVRGAAFSPDGTRLATASTGNSDANSGVVQLWDFRSATPMRAPLPGGDYGQLQFSRDGRLLAGANMYGQLAVWNGVTGELIATPRSDRRVASAQFSPDGTMIIAGSDGGVDGDYLRTRMTQIWKSATGEPVTNFAHQGVAAYAQFSPNGEWVIATSADATARVWDWRTGKPLTDPMRHEGGVLWTDVSPDSRWIVTLARDHAARIWDATSGRLVHTLPTPAEPYTRNSAKFSPDGRFVAVASGTLAQVWAVDSGSPVGPPLKHAGRVHSVRFSPDSARLLTSSYDAFSRIWDVATAHLLNEPIRHDARVNYAEFHPNGRWFVTASDDGLARIVESPLLTSATPPWLADFTEVLAGQWLDDRNASQPASIEALVRVKKGLADAPPDDEAARWAHWIMNDSPARPLSPNSSISVSQMIERNLEQNTAPRLQEAVRLDPANGRAIARLALASLTNGPSRSADWLSRRAASVTSDDPEVFRARAELCRLTGTYSDAIDAINRAIALGPTNAECWNERGLVLERVGKTQEALDSYTKAILYSGPWKSIDTLPSLAYANRSRLEWSRQRFAEAGRDQVRARHLPERDPATPATRLDLSYFYNDNDDSTVPPAWKTLAPTFDVRGGIYFGYEKSGEVTGIPVNQKCSQIRFLHATSGQNSVDGVKIGYYRIHYRDGRQALIPIVYGGNVRSLQELMDKKLSLTGQGHIAWSGERSRLFAFTWDNEQPDIEIVTLDLVCLKTGTTPALFAVTLEP